MGKDKKRLIRKIEKYLRSYTSYRAGLVTMKRQLDYIVPNVQVKYGITDSKEGVFKIGSGSDYCLDQIDSKRVIELYEDVKKYNLIVESIDEALKELDEVERNFIEIRYINRSTIVKTSMKMGYSEKHILNIRTQALEKLLISLKGLEQF